MPRHGLSTLIHRVPAGAVVVVEVFLLLHVAVAVLDGLLRARACETLKRWQPSPCWVRFEVDVVVSAAQDQFLGIDAALKCRI